MPYCSNCGEEVEDSASFCSNCGNELDSGTNSESDGSKDSDEKLESSKLDKEGKETAKKLREDGDTGDNEKVIVHSRQSRVKSTIHPASLVVTENQLVHYKPEFIGSSTQTRKVNEITDISIDSGLRNATITIRTSAMDNLEFEDFPKDDVKEIRDAVRRLA